MPNLPMPAADYLKRADLRTVARLVSDTDTAVTTGALASDPNLTAALAGGSGDFVAMVTAMGRYTTASLNALSGTALESMYDLLAPLVTKRVYQRRPDKSPQGHPPGYVEALWRCQRVQTGDEVLS